MKNKPRIIIQFILRFFSERIIKKYKPDIVVITGSVGKTSSKEACFYVLSTKLRIRRTEENYNTEIGVPLTIIGANSAGRSIFKWICVFFKATFLIVIKSKKYPAVLILEIAADKPGDIEYFMSFLRPKVSIITNISHVHLEKFGVLSRIIAEKRKAIENLSRDSFAILNFDDEILVKMALKTDARILTYGVLNKDVDARAEDAKVMLKDNKLGLYFKFLHKETAIPVFVEGAAAPHYVYSLLAAAALGIAYNLTPLDITKGLEAFSPLLGRFTTIKTLKNQWFIDDTYNASPVSTCAALDALASFPHGDRKIAVLADMLELGSFEEAGHKQVGAHAASLPLDMLVTYGILSEAIVKSAKQNGMNQNTARHFDSYKEAVAFLRFYLTAGDCVLFKGSRGMKTERILRALL